MNYTFRILLSGFLLITNSLFADESVKAPCPTLAMSGTSVSCYGYSNGSALVAYSGGSGNYTITWSNGVTTPSNPGLAVGTYTVNVKDNVSGCSVIGAYVVGSPDPISVSGIVTNVNCFGNATGSVDISVLGGTPAYSYSWKNSFGVTVATTQDLLNVFDGTYTITITDFKGCTHIRSYTITEPAEPVNNSAVLTNTSCFAGANGSINLEAWGGTAPYTYSWSSGQSSQDIANLTAGGYTVTITDFKGCQKIQSYNITQPTILGGTSSTSNVLCYGSPTGSASFSPVGGTPPYSYSWQNSTTLFSSNTATLSNVVADNYQVTVTDSKGCQYLTNMTIGQPTLLVGSLSITNVTCNGGIDGAIDLTVSGGTFPYAYQWTNSVPVNVGSGQDLTNVVAEYYEVLITDGNGCELSIEGEVTEPQLPISVTETITHVLCYGDNTGAIDLFVLGGTAPYTYTWSSGQTTQDVNNLLSGVYGYTVIDYKGCTYSNVLTVTQPAQPLTVTNSILDVNCYGESNGEIDLTVTGGTVSYTYTWENSTYNLSATSEDLNGFPADSYHYQVTDANGCIEIDTLTIIQPTQMTTSITGVNILCYDGNTGLVDLTIGGGVLPYSYNWNNGYTTEDLNTLIAGTYSVIVSDDHNCIITNQITLTQPLDSLSHTYFVKDVLCNDGTTGEIELIVAGGTTPYSYLWSNGDLQSQISELTAGMYTFTVMDFNGCLLSDSMYVDQPDPLTLNEVITPVTCNGLSDGIINVSPLGGTSPYQFTWYNSLFALSAQTEDLNNYPADIYQVEIIDSNNCFYEMFFEIEQPELLVITFTSSVASCFGSSDADILVDIAGGNPPYTATWSNGATTEDLMDVPAGTYELVVVDTKGCTDSIEATIIEPLPITMAFEVTEITCIDQKDGTAMVTASGGNDGFYYDWSHGATTDFVDSLDYQYYFLLVTDVLGCTGTDSVFIPKNDVVCIDPVNTFTPNGDNYNDTWFIENMYLYPNMEMQIFNRWGNLIHKQEGLYEPWNGKMHAVEAPSEVYYYILNLNTPDRKPLTGNITIVR